MNAGWILTFCLGFAAAYAGEPDWSEGTQIVAPRTNPYGFSAAELQSNRTQGLSHALNYPVSVSGLWMPWRPIKKLLDETPDTRVLKLIQSLLGHSESLHSSDALWASVGLHAYPKSSDEKWGEIPAPNDAIPNVRMGVSLRRMSLPGGNATEVLSLSCATCHSSNLFGKKILGMTNRFPAANRFFVEGQLATAAASPFWLREVTHSSTDEIAWYERLRQSTTAIGARLPVTLGLDTSLAQVALSLAKRNPDPWATKSEFYEQHPQEERLRDVPADSKPAVWWNTKYKNRWLSDGSVVSGNPVLTNILWNEIGRGTDLTELDDWIGNNGQVIQEMTTAVFSTEAPRITDFFPAEKIDLSRAKNGQTIFLKTCSGCHGKYEKAWDQGDAEILPLAEQLRTTRVWYHEKTPVIDVGTDALRRQGMASLERRLNPLEFSKRNGIEVREQKGYVPPPLVGIWARFPYFHNNSVPSLCAVLTPAPKRPITYWAGPTEKTDRDYDWECAGYPTGDQVPGVWKKNKAWFYDTRKQGLGNSGHDQKIFIKDGKEILSAEEKRDLIEFLKTL